MFEILKVSSENKRKFFEWKKLFLYDLKMSNKSAVIGAVVSVVPPPFVQFFIQPHLSNCIIPFANAVSIFCWFPEYLGVLDTKSGTSAIFPFIINLFNTNKALNLYIEKGQN